jgi:hypothetical protein
MYCCASEAAVTKDSSDRLKVLCRHLLPLIFNTIAVISVAKYCALSVPTK